MPSTSFELRELFHLLFLRALAQRLAGRAYALKGGICLRFFHRSPRLSEDIDFDVSARLGTNTLRDAVDSILEARSLRLALTPQGLTGLEITKPKQTETVQRWKIGLLIGGSRLPTKIEFSRRQKTVDFEMGTPTPDLLESYRLSPFAAQYYGSSSMMLQKIQALSSASRSATRDLFDLHHLLLFSKSGSKKNYGGLNSETFRSASEKIEGFHYDDFAQEVLPYLTASLISLYSDSEAFEKLKSETLKGLKEAGP